MELSLLTICFCSILYIWVLPWIFFRKNGKKNIKWFMTAFPFMLAPVIPLAQYLSILEPSIQLPIHLVWLQTVVCTILPMISISIMSLTIGTHRIPVALWHQKHSDDEPEYVVTWGAYARIRHPFYTSFIIAAFSLLLLTLHWTALVVFIYVSFVLRYTAIKEEIRLSNEKSGMGKEYLEYITRTGRFFPRLTGASGER